MQEITARDNTGNSRSRSAGLDFKSSRDDKELTSLVKANIENRKKGIDGIVIVLKLASSCKRSSGSIRYF